MFIDADDDSTDGPPNQGPGKVVDQQSSLREAAVAVDAAPRSRERA
jgi:hypothetical protein